MKHVNYLSFFLLTLFSISFISCSDDDDNKLNTGITNQSWTEGKSLEISQDNELSVSFNAAAKWVASVTSGADWCKLNTTSGTKGQSTLKLSVSTSSTTDRTARISINIDGYSPASFEVTQKGTSAPQTTEDMEINAKVDEYLREMYLWNDEYKTLKPDFTKNYEAFFYDALGSLTTNTLDKKTYVGSDGKTYYNLFSYIQLLPNISSTRTTKIVNKELAYSFGITGITPISIGTQAENTIYFCLQGVYPDSPASEAGLKRGAMISLINGKKINNNNINNFYYDILLPDATINYTLTEDVVEASKASTGNISLEMTELNFVELVNQVIGEFEEKFEERNLKMVVHFDEEEAIICADGRRLWRVLENVFGNVSKYAMENTRVYVDVKVDRPNVQLSLKNISAQPLNISADELTERFIRGDVSRNTEGSGLGLSIAKDLVQLQGGEFRLYLDGDLFKVTIEFKMK